MDKIENVSLDSTSIKVHPDGIVILKKMTTGHWYFQGQKNTKIHLVAADPGYAFRFALSPGNIHDESSGRKLLKKLQLITILGFVLMDRTYESFKTRNIVKKLGMMTVVISKVNTKNPWLFDKDLYKNRNVIERLFRRSKAFRKIFSRFDRPNVIFLGFLSFSLIIIPLK